MNIMVSATDKNLEQYAVNLFKSYKKFNYGTDMYCICRDVSSGVLNELKKLGVKIICPNDLPEDMRNVSVQMYRWLKDINFHQVLWIDIDALVLGYINDLFVKDAVLVGLPGNSGHGWKYMKEDGSPYVALGVFKVWKRTLKKMWEEYEKVGKPMDEGEFIREHIDDFMPFLQLEGELYNVGREMLPDLVYNGKNQKTI